MTHANTQAVATGLEDCTHHKLRSLVRLVGRRCDERLAPVGIKGTQMAMLSYLSRVGSSRLSCAAAAMGMDISTLSRNLAVLAQQGWVQVRPDADGRNRRVHTTVAGCAKLAEAAPALDAAQRALEHCVGVQGLALMNQLLDQTILLLANARD